MELPEDVLRLVKEYSMPATRSDWRTLHLMPHDKYISEYDYQYRARLKYIHSHDNYELTGTLNLYKNVFCGYRYWRMMKLNEN